MKDYSFKINVWDLVKKPWSKDCISFKNKFHKEINNITDKWIEWEVEIQSLNKDSVLINILKLNLEINKLCDICDEKMIDKLIIKNFNAKFLKKNEFTEKEENNDENFFFNEKDSNIDLNDLIYQIIQWENKIINICNNCKKKENNIEEDNQLLENKIVWK